MTEKSKNAELWEHVDTNLIRYKPNGKYYLKAKIHGKKIRQCLETNTLKEARHKLAAFMVRIRGGAVKGTGGNTVGSLVEEWKIWLKNKRQSPMTTRSRLNNLELILRTWPQLSSMKINAVTSHDVEVWRDSLLTKTWKSPKGNRKYSTAAANQCLGTLRSIFKLASARGMLLTDNPCLKVKVVPQVNQKTLKLPTLEEFAKLRAMIYSESKSGGELFDFLALSGTRIESSRNATWGNIDWDKNTLTFVKAKRRPYTIPMMASLKKFLLDIMPADAKPTDRITKQDSIKKVLGTSCRRLKLPHLSHHSLRHWFITRKLENPKIDFYTLSKWVGHKDSVLLQKTYAHSRDEHSQALAKET
jgi:integrase